MPVVICKHPLMMRINEISFTMDDLRLYLDTHPNCTEALAYFDELQEQRRAAVAAYEAQFGPLTSYGNVESGCDDWKWARGPWPWQNY